MTSSWPLAFLWTCALELPIYVLVIGRRFERWWAACLLTFVLNAATHPVLWFLFPRFDPLAVWLVVAEGWVTFVEAATVTMVLWRTTSFRGAAARGVIAALAANAFSAALGLILG
jgi:hypothetical protein